MKALFGIVGLLLVLGVMSLLVKKQVSGAAAPGQSAPAQQVQQVRQQVEAAQQVQQQLQQQQLQRAVPDDK
jgi:hypothetical protein